MRAVAAFKLKLTFLQGETFDRTFTWKTGTPAVPVDLTGCSARSQFRAKIDAPDVLLQLSSDDGSIVLGGAAGTIRYRLSAAATAALAWRSAVHDLELTFPDGTVRRLISGQAEVSPEVTRG